MNHNSASSKIVREQADKSRSAGGSNNAAQTSQVSEEQAQQNLDTAVASVRAALGRLNEQLQAASEEDKPALKAKIEALMKDLCLEIVPPATTTEGADKPATDTAEQPNGDTKSDNKDGKLKGLFTWVKENKVKTAAIAAATVAAVGAVVYAVRSGRADKLSEAATSFGQRATEAMEGMFSGGAETLAEAATDATADAAAGDPSFMSKLGGGLSTAGTWVKSAWSFVATNAIKGKDIVVGWFSANSAAAADVVAGAPDVAMAAV